MDVRSIAVLTRAVDDFAHSVVRFQLGCRARPCETMRHRMNKAVEKHTTTVTIEPSSPNCPPVRIAGPLKVPAIKPLAAPNPDTPIPKTLLSEKFQAACIAIGNHSSDPTGSYPLAESSYLARKDLAHMSR